jgi:energy-coupling factor transporter transmembrane protein EcfT
MHRHYSRIQIYTFSNNLELILKQIEQDLDVNLGASYICVIFILIFMSISFLTSSTVEIEMLSSLEQIQNKPIEQKRTFIPTPRIERFVSSNETRFTRQTKV